MDYTNTVSAFEETKPVHASMFNSKEVGLTTTAIFGGITGLKAAGGLQGASQGGPENVGGVGEAGCCKVDQCNHTIYLI